MVGIHASGISIPLSLLMNPIESNQVAKTNRVLNLSSRSLTDVETSLLKKGLNFAITPSRIPAAEIIAKVESAIRILDDETADSVRRSVNNIL